jgi:hypothetical protein
VGDIDIKVISAAENSNKFQKTRFWKEKSVEDGNTWANRTDHNSKIEIGTTNRWETTSSNPLDRSIYISNQLETGSSQSIRFVSMVLPGL